MLHKHLPFITFSIILLLFSNWHIFISTLTGFWKPKAPFSRLENPELSLYIKEKTGTEITTFYIVNSDAVFGGMTGIPTKPVMTISKGMYDLFSAEELQYVLLHETGHYVLQHLLKELAVQGSIILLAFFVFRSIKYPLPISMSLALVSAFLIGIIIIQMMRSYEWEADTYALEHLDDSQSMITATKKLEAAWSGPADDSLTRFLFYRGVPYSQRIKHAESFQ